MGTCPLPVEHYVTITISDDKMIGYLELAHLDETIQITLEQLDELLKKHHITHGIHLEKLSLICMAPLQYLQQKIVIAEGDQPIEGKPGSIRFTYELDGNSKGPSEQGDGKVDYRDIGKLNNVQKGQPIAHKIPAQEGNPGQAVTGEVIYAKRGKEARFKMGKNVVTDSDQMVLYAAIDGLVTKTDGDKINVFPVYEVNGDVDYNIGNIDFVGTVVIHGNVLNGFRIKASGDIRVIGGVEGAELAANGSIEITAGILGHHKGFVKAGSNVKSSFIQDANVTAGEDVVVSQSIMHSQIRAGKNVICKENKGLIVGGIVQAGEKVIARTIGNTMSTVTIIEVGVLPELRNELANVREQMKEIKDNLDKTGKALNLLDHLASKGQLSPEKLALRIKLNNTNKLSVDQLNAMKERSLEIEKSLEDTDKALIEAASAIYGGSKLVIGRYTKFVKDTAQKVSFRIFEGDISMTSSL